MKQNITEAAEDDENASFRVRTIADLGRLAGVSAGTVSRALAGKSLVNVETRERIRALAAAHGFRPNQMASRLRTRRTGVIGVVVPLGHERRQHLSDPFFMTMLGLFADQLTERGYDLMLSRVIPDASDWLEQSVDSGMLDGVLLIGQSDQRATIERVARRYLPLVVWGTTEPGQVHCAVGVDNVAGGRLAGAHLLARGCRRIAFLGETRAPELRARAEGVRAALVEAGRGADLPILPAPLASDTMEREVAAQLDALGGAVDGIAAASDMLAMTALRVLADRGIAVPERMRVTGYDDLPLAVQTVPRLTTIRQDMGRGAEAMVEALFARMGGTASPGLVMPPELVVRDSA